MKLKALSALLLLLFPFSKKECSALYFVYSAPCYCPENCLGGTAEQAQKLFEANPNFQALSFTNASSYLGDFPFEALKGKKLKSITFLGNDSDAITELPESFYANITADTVYFGSTCAAEEAVFRRLKEMPSPPIVLYEYFNGQELETREWVARAAFDLEALRRNPVLEYTNASSEIDELPFDMLKGLRLRKISFYGNDSDFIHELHPSFFESVSVDTVFFGATCGYSQPLADKLMGMNPRPVLLREGYNEAGQPAYKPLERPECTSVYFVTGAPWFGVADACRVREEKYAEDMAYFFSNNPQLHSLEFTNGSGYLDQTPFELLKGKKLRKITFSGNDADSIGNLPEAFYQSVQVDTVQFSWCRYSEEMISRLKSMSPQPLLLESIYNEETGGYEPRAIK